MQLLVIQQGVRVEVPIIQLILLKAQDVANYAHFLQVRYYIQVWIMLVDERAHIAIVFGSQRNCVPVLYV